MAKATGMALSRFMVRAGAVAFGMFVHPAIAEVCDKVAGEAWTPQHGAVWLLNPVGFPIGLVLISIILIVATLGRRLWITFSALVLVVLYTVILGFTRFSQGEIQIIYSAIEEGRLSSATLVSDIALLFGAILFLMWRNWRIIR